MAAVKISGTAILALAICSDRVLRFGVSDKNRYCCNQSVVITSGLILAAREESRQINKVALVRC